MSTITVCGLDDMPMLAATRRPTYLVSLLAPSYQPRTPSCVEPRHHLRVEIDDVDRPEDGYIVPARSHVEQLIAFLRECQPDHLILIHCLAGISRSPAAALIALALENPGREREAAAILRRAAPHVDPNRLVLALADDALARNGALRTAGEAMGACDLFVDVPYFDVSRRLLRPGDPSPQ